MGHDLVYEDKRSVRGRMLFLFALFIILMENYLCWYRIGELVFMISFLAIYLLLFYALFWETSSKFNVLVYSDGVYLPHTVSGWRRKRIDRFVPFSEVEALRREDRRITKAPIPSLVFKLRSGQEYVYQNTQAVAFEGQETLCLNQYDQVVYLSLHALKHSASRLVWLADIKNIFHCWDGHDWDALKGRATELGRIESFRTFFFS